MIPPNPYPFRAQKRLQRYFNELFCWENGGLRPCNHLEEPVARYAEVELQ